MTAFKRARRSLPRALFLSSSLFAGLSKAASYAIPSAPPSTAASLDPAPLGISLEFFTFPSYFENVTATEQCLANLEALTGTWPPLRIGGTTQDRATYDPNTSAYVVYSVASAADAPASLTFGPNFMKLAGTYDGTVVLGLNRGHDNITNTIAAAKVAKSDMSNLLAIELGNEPEYWLSDDQPIALEASSWTPAVDAASQDNWDVLVGQAIGATNIIQAGNSNDAPPTWGAAELIATENSTVQKYVYDYAHHNYPGGTVTSLMLHSDIVSNLAVFNADIAAAKSVGKPYVLGETNSVSGGGAATVSPTFGAALWTLDYTLRAAASSISRIYYHQGTIGNCYYCFWGRYDMGAPYYGAYVATAAMAGGAHIAAIDAGSDAYGVYVIYNAAGAKLRAVLYNSNYYAGTGTRSSNTFSLTGLGATTSAKLKRFTAPSALARQDQGGNPSFGGQYFTNGTCVIAGTETYETVGIASGSANVSVAASEAVVIYF